MPSQTSQSYYKTILPHQIWADGPPEKRHKSTILKKECTSQIWQQVNVSQILSEV